MSDQKDEAANGSAGKRAAVVLGAGGARGLAHIGALQVLSESGFEISAIAGSSMGALVGGIHAAGRLDEYAEWVSALERSDVVKLLDFAFGRPGLFKGERIIGALRELVGEHQVEDLPIPYIAVATDIRSQREVWISRGPLFDAIRASIAIPMVFTPHTLRERELVDGGLLAPVPIAATRLFDADLVVAVDVNAHANPPALRASSMDIDQSEAEEDAGQSKAPESGAEEAKDGDKPAATTRAKIDDFFSRLIGRDSKAPPAKAEAGLMELMSLSLDTVQARISHMQLALDPPDVLVRVSHRACFFYEFWRAKEMIEIGRNAARVALDGYQQRR